MRFSTRMSLPLAVLGLACIALVAPPLYAQEGSATAPVTAEAGTPAASPTITGTPTITPTPTATPTATPTFTALEARLALAKAYLEGGDLAKAVELFSALVLETRGDPEAVAGLNAALQAQQAAAATAEAPPPTAPPPTLTPVAPGPDLRAAFAEKWVDFAGTAVAALVMGITVFVVVRVLRWLFGWLRELWMVRILPLLNRPPGRPGIVIGSFTNATGDTGFEGPKIVAQALAEQLTGWNEAVQPELQNAIATDKLDTVGLAWLSTLWSQIFPPQRVYKVSGVLMGRQPGPYQLAVERLDVFRNRIDASHTFEGNADTPAQTFRELAATAALWLRDPAGMESTPALLEVPVRAPGLAGARTPALLPPSAGGTGRLPPTPSQIAAEVLKILVPLRRQVTAGDVDYPSAPRLLDEAQSLAEGLPQRSSLRNDLESAIEDLRRQLQPGRAPG